ncbi:DUF6735 family protein [Halorussus litoreus]|uniref:DUF6735 family protein n=1 Tax=Halorussus litoreus TaxID=1710536 RepID=UPI000E2850FF|nr:DUF6735 family protein [Halorussus litoreus]
MGHRALVAYRRDADSLDSEDAADLNSSDANSSDTGYDLHRSHWGGADFALLDGISAEEPYAADTQFAVDPQPVATDRSLADAAANHLDFLHHEAFYRVDSDYEVTAYHVLWFGLEADAEAVERSETVGHGALVEAHRDDSDYLRGWFRGAKEVVAEMVDRGALTPAAASDALAERAETWADDREVIVPE